MATVRKRGPYQWQAQARKKGQPLQTKTFETRAVAEQWARAIEVEMIKGVSWYWWLDTVVPSTVDKVLQIARIFSNPTLNPYDAVR